MDDFKKLEQIFKEPITIDNINRINDCFIRYLFSADGSESIDMKTLLKEDTVFELVKEKSESFLCDNPLIDTYKRKEIDEYFNKRMIDYEIKNAMNKGIEKGIEQSKIEIARNLKKAGIDINIISENTGLSIEEIEKL